MAVIKFPSDHRQYLEIRGGKNQIYKIEIQNGRLFGFRYIKILFLCYCQPLKVSIYPFIFYGISYNNYWLGHFVTKPPEEVSDKFLTTKIVKFCNMKACSLFHTYPAYIYISKMVDSRKSVEIIKI